MPKQQLYSFYKELLELGQQKLTLRYLLDDVLNSATHKETTLSSDNTSHARLFKPSQTSHNTQRQFSLSLNKEKQNFRVEHTSGDGWCAFTAIGMNNLIECIEALVTLCRTRVDVREALSETILQNCVPSLNPERAHDTFEIDDSLKREITRRQKALSDIGDKISDAEQQSEKKFLTKERTRLNNDFISYLASKDVCIAYLEKLKENRYVHIGVVKTYAKCILKKDVFVITRYNEIYISPPASEDIDVDKSLFVLFEPGTNMLQAHYSRLTHLPSNQAEKNPSDSMSNQKSKV